MLQLLTVGGLVQYQLPWPEGESRMCCNGKLHLERQVREGFPKEWMMTGDKWQSSRSPDLKGAPFASGLVPPR